MLVRRKIIYTRHPFDEELWEPLKEEWRLIYLEQNRDLSTMLSLCMSYLRSWLRRLASRNHDELALSLLSYFKNPEKTSRGIRRLVRVGDLELSDLHYLMIEVLRSSKKIYSRLSPRQAAFFLHRFFLFRLKDYIRSRIHPQASQEGIRDALHSPPYVEQDNPSLFPISPLIELYADRTEEELAKLLTTYEVDVGRRKKQLLLKLRTKIKGL
jgi:hypothetical protein